MMSAHDIIELFSQPLGWFCLAWYAFGCSISFAYGWYRRGKKATAASA